MTPRTLKQVFLGGAVAAFAISYSIADIVSRVIVTHSSIGDAIHNHLQTALLQPFGTLLLAVPFMVFGWLGYRLGSLSAVKRGVVLLAAASLVLGYFYFRGLYGSQEALLQRKWTAAALSVGLLPFFVGIPAVACAFVVYFLAKPRVEV